MSPAGASGTGRWEAAACRCSACTAAPYTAGRHDEIRPDHVEDMRRATDGSRFELFESSAHLPFEEERERFMALLRKWLAEHDGCGESSGTVSTRTSR